MKHIYEDLAYGPVPVQNSYWRSTVDAPLSCDTATGEIRCDVAVIGAGFTGLNAAIPLARAGRDVVVLEAETPGWGASGRNGGFCCLGGAKASASELTRRYGQTATQDYIRAERRAVDHVHQTLETGKIEADTHSNGETLVAHRPAAVAGLETLAEEIHHFHKVSCKIMPAAAMAEHGMKSAAFHGALTNPIGFGLNPLKYLHGLVGIAQVAGIRIHGGSPVTGLGREDGRHVLSLPAGRVLARTLIVATNGYSSEDIPGWLNGRYLPSQSNVLVTRPLSDDELSAQGWTTRQMCFDTRNLLHYFRLMPNNRMLFGMRGSLRTTQRSLLSAAAATRQDFERIFPAWRHVETPYSWSGLVCLSRSLTPFAGPVPGLDNAYAALAYHGNGVAMGSYAGRLLAGQILGEDGDGRHATPDIMLRPMRRFELGPLRRLSLPLAYTWYGLRDRL